MDNNSTTTTWCNWECSTTTTTTTGVEVGTPGVGVTHSMFGVYGRDAMNGRLRSGAFYLDLGLCFMRSGTSRRVEAPLALQCPRLRTNDAGWRQALTHMDSLAATFLHCG